MQNRGFGFDISLPPGRQRRGAAASAFFAENGVPPRFSAGGTVLYPCSWVKGCAVSVLFGWERAPRLCFFG